MVFLNECVFALRGQEYCHFFVILMVVVFVYDMNRLGERFFFFFF